MIRPERTELELADFVSVFGGQYVVPVSMGQGQLQALLRGRLDYDGQKLRLARSEQGPVLGFTTPPVVSPPLPSTRELQDNHDGTFAVILGWEDDPPEGLTVSWHLYVASILQGSGSSAPPDGLSVIGVGEAGDMVELDFTVTLGESTSAPQVAGPFGPLVLESLFERAGDWPGTAPLVTDLGGGEYQVSWDPVGLDEHEGATRTDYQVFLHGVVSGYQPHFVDDLVNESVFQGGVAVGPNTLVTSFSGVPEGLDLYASVQATFGYNGVTWQDGVLRYVNKSDVEAWADGAGGVHGGYGLIEPAQLEGTTGGDPADPTWPESGSGFSDLPPDYLEAVEFSAGWAAALENGYIVELNGLFYVAHGTSDRIPIDDGIYTFEVTNDHTTSIGFTITGIPYDSLVSACLNGLRKTFSVQNLAQLFWINSRYIAREAGDPGEDITVRLVSPTEHLTDTTASATGTAITVQLAGDPDYVSAVEQDNPVRFMRFGGSGGDSSPTWWVIPTASQPGPIVRDTTSRKITGQQGLWTGPIHLVIPITTLPFTYEVWVMPGSSFAANEIFANDAASAFRIHADGTLELYNGSDHNDHVNTITSSVQLLPDVWYLVGIVQSDVAADSKIYVNGVDVSVVNGTGPVFNPLQPSDRAGWWNNGESWSGSWGEVAFYTGALPADRHLAHYQSGVSEAATTSTLQDVKDAVIADTDSNALIAVNVDGHETDLAEAFGPYHLGLPS